MVTRRFAAKGESFLWFAKLLSSNLILRRGVYTIEESYYTIVSRASGVSVGWNGYGLAFGDSTRRVCAI